MAPVRTANLNTAFIDSATDISGNSRDWTVSGLTSDPQAPFPVGPFYKTGTTSGTVDTGAGASLSAVLTADE